MGRYVTNVERMLQRMGETSLVLNLTKCKFIKATVQYLGYVVEYDNVCHTDSRAVAINELRHSGCITPRCREMCRPSSFWGHERWCHL